MMSMNQNAFSVSVGRPAGPVESPSGAWRTLPLAGHFDLVYEDATGAWSNRSLSARELKLGPGRTLLGGVDARRGGYRGFRVDRIRRLTDGATGERIETGILDRLLGRADAQRRADAMRIRRQTQARRRTALADRPGAIRTV
jgi:predicted DNA-binding transcriptional regulator YafY